jgi:Calx-beta domain
MAGTVTSVNDATVLEGKSAIFTVSLANTTIAPTQIALEVRDVTTSSSNLEISPNYDYYYDIDTSLDGGQTWTQLPRNSIQRQNFEVPVGFKDFQVRVNTIIDATIEPNETFTLTARGVSDIIGTEKTGTGTIVDRGAFAPEVISVSKPSVVEGEQAVFTVELSDSTLSTTVRLDISRIDGVPTFATLGTDFTGNLEASFDLGATWIPVSGNELPVAAGIKSFQVRTLTLTDNLVEGNESFFLNASILDGVDIFIPRRTFLSKQIKVGQATIIDKPTNPPIALSVSNASTDEGNYGFFTVGYTTLEPTNIQLALASGTATIGQDFSTLLEVSFNFGATWSSVPANGQVSVATGTKDFQVRAIALTDNIKEIAETFTLTASANGATATGTGTIQDVPIDGAKVIRVSNARGIEGEKEVFTVGLSAKTSRPTILELNLASGTATLGTDFSATLEVSFDLGKTWDTVRGDGKLVMGAGIKDFQVRAMTTIDAVLNEGKETFKLTASANGGTAVGTGTIVDKRFIGAIAIDLNGDGIQTLNIDNGVKFDIANSGEKLSTGWISNADAFLAFDKDCNGKIDSRAELFGGGVGQGFAKLDSFDSNRDGLVNAQDARFSKLKVWQDKNSNGITDSNELFSLSDVGIVSLKVAYTSNFTLDAMQNILGERSLATTNMGKTTDLINTYFQVASSSSFLSTND